MGQFLKSHFLGNTKFEDFHFEKYFMMKKVIRQIRIQFEKCDFKRILQLNPKSTLANTSESKFWVINLGKSHFQEKRQSNLKDNHEQEAQSKNDQS